MARKVSKKKVSKKATGKKKPVAFIIDPEDRVYGKGSKRSKSFKYNTRSLKGQFIKSADFEREQKQIEKIKRKNPKISKKELRKIIYPKLPTITRTLVGDALTFRENWESYRELGVRVKIIDINGQSFTYGRKNFDRADSLVELQIGNLWRLCTEARKQIESSGKKASPDVYIPQFAITIVQDAENIQRIIIDFSKSNANGFKFTSEDEFTDSDTFQEQFRGDEDFLNDDDDDDF